MANNSPTIVAASLSDDQLKTSINNLVAHVDEAMKKMVQSTNNAVGEMEAKLKSLGNLKIDSGGSADGGASKRAKAQNAETDAVEKTITARGKQIKQNQETAMSFDQIAAALDKARRTVSDFNTKRASGILPSSEDYKRYEQALARIVEYNDKLKQSALSRADANQWANVFDAKRVISDLSAVDDRYKKLVRWYSVLEKEDQRRIASDEKANQKRLADLEKEKAAREKMIESARKAEQKYQDATLKSAFRGALTLPTNNIDELRYKIERITTLTSTLRKEGLIDEAQVNRANAAVAKLNEQLNKQLATEKDVKAVQSQQTQPQVKSARDSYIAFMQGYKQQAEQIRRLMEEEQKAMQQRRQGVVDGFTKTIEERKARVKELSEEITKLYKERPGGYRDAIKQRTEEMNALKQKIRELTEAQKNLADSPIGTSNRYLELEKEYNRIKNIMIDTTNVQRQSTQETERQTQSAQRYTEEIRKQAQAIRESQQWKEKGVVTVNGVDIYNLENSTKRRISLEEQLVALLHEEKTATSQVAQEQLNVAKNAAVTNEQLEKARALSNKGIGTTANAKDGTVPTFTTQLESANALSKRLKELKEQYNSLSYGKRLGAEGQAIAQQIREITRQGQILNNQLNRPTKKEVFGLSEKTLDDIAYKMRQLASYRSGLDANAQHNEIRRVNYEYDVLKKKMDEIMQKNSQMVSSNTALGRSWNYMKNRLAFYFTVGASTQFVKNLIEVRSQYEMNERALGILVDSAERGTQIFRELSDMALVSPYTLIELSSAAKQLTAYDVAAKDVVDTTRRLADMASAVGVPVERLTYALGQIKAYGYLNSRDARMFANAGIPLVKELADHYTRLEGRLVSTADIYDRIKKKAIDYNDVMQVMNEMTDEGGKFYDFQAKMADTLKVQLANLTLAWNNMLNDLGNSQQGLLTSGIGALKELFLHWKDLDRILTNLAITIGTAKAAQLLLNMSFGKGTLAAIKNISAIEGNTAAMYENALSKSNLSKAEARWLVSTNRSNVALRAAMVNMKLLTVEEAKAAASTTVLGVRMGWLGRVMKTNFFGLASVVRGAAVGMEMLGKAMLSIITNPVFLTITAAMAVTDALLYYNQVAEKTAEMNKAIADNAKEASEAIGDYLKDSVNIGNRAKAAQGVLSVSEGQKAWESIREQIELSSDAASVFISKLLEEEDINKRVKEGFNVAESIREATNAMAGLNAEALKVSQDSWLWGAFGEGLAEDLEDYIEAVQRGRKNGANIGSRYFASGERKEAMDELTAFANDAEKIIRDRLGAGVNDAVQLKEAIERIKKEVIAANPQIKGEVKKWFDVEVDRMMAERFGGVYNELSSIQSQFIEHIKRDSGAALRRLSDDILDTSKELDDDVLGAISKAWDKLKDELPAESQDLISKLQKQMDENPLTLRVLLLQAGEQQIRDAIQKDYEQHFFDSNIGEKPTRPKDVGSLWGDYKGDYKAFAAAQEKHEKEMVEYNQKNAEWEAKRAEYVAKYGDFNKKNDETRAKWAKRVNDEIKAADAEEKAAKHAREALESELSLEERKTDARYLSAVKEEQEAKNRKSAAQEAWNYEKLYQEEKGKGRKGSKKDPLLDALKQEISLVEKLQSDYDKLSKSGASQADALDTIRGAYGKTIRLLNAQLGSYGLPQIDISQLITGKDPNKALAHFKQTLDTLVSKGMLTLERSKELEAVVEKFTLSAKTYNLDMITKGLNNELGKLKDEYELAVELDANPELGGVFADMIGIDKETLSQLPKDFNGVVEKLQQIVDDKLGNGKFSVLGNLNKSALDSWLQQNQVKIDSDRGKALVAITEYANKIRKDETEKQVKEWDKLLEKYAEYEYKRKEIFDEFEREMAIARKQNASDEIISAIENKRNERLADLEFDKFAKTPEWIVATGELANMSKSALDLLINKIQEYRRTAKNLLPKQIKQLNKALKDLYKEQRANNPFNYIKNMMERAKEKAEVFDESISETTDKISELEVSIFKAKEAGKDTTAAEDKLKTLRTRLQELKEARDAAMEIDATAWAGAFNEWVGAVKSITSSFDDLLNAVGANKLTSRFNEVFGVLEKAGSMASTGAQIGGKWGAIVGGIVGAASGIITAMSDTLSGNAAINSEISDSVEQVKRLENTYKLLNDAIKDAYGTAEIGAKRAIMVNKELQLEELKRQLVLEESRESKNRDDEKIENLKGQIIDLELELKNTTREIVNDLMGISSVGDAAEQMVSSMITAFKKGEKYMESYKQAFDSMVENLIMKSIVGQVIGSKLETIFAQVEEFSKKRADETLFKASDVTGGEFADLVGSTERTFEGWASTLEKWISNPNIPEQDKAKYNKWLENLRKLYTQAITPTIEDVKGIEAKKDEWEGEVKEIFDAYMDAFGINFGQDAQAKLSALKQGIQGITEDTAGALEAITNGISQQCYLQSDILIQIRDTVQSFDIDIQTASLSQILLQLQSSYQLQQSMLLTMENWTNPSGNAVRVELIS